MNGRAINFIHLVELVDGAYAHISKDLTSMGGKGEREGKEGGGAGGKGDEIPR